MLTRSYACIYYHFVWSTKYWRSTIRPECRQQLYDYIAGIALKKGWPLLSIGGTSDHVHILLKMVNPEYFPQIASCLKSNSSRFVRQKFDKNFSWQRGFGVFSVDIPSIPRIKNYIARQEEHHKNKKMSFEDEFNALLRRHDKV
jgi:putative transposase